MAVNAANAPIHPWYEAIWAWWQRIRHRRLKAAFFAIVVALAALPPLFFPWGAWPPHGLAWHDWKTEPASGADAQVLTALLVQNRTEVRFWQDVLFKVSLAFTAGVLGIVSLALKMKADSEWLRWTYALAIVFLAAFYLIFVKVSENAIALNHHDLTGIEIGLKLSKEGAYIQGQSIYDHSEARQKEGKGERFITQLVPFGIVLAVLSVFAILFGPIPHQEAGRPDGPQ